MSSCPAGLVEPMDSKARGKTDGFLEISEYLVSLSVLQLIQWRQLLK
jgi:hypothetical protein